MTRSLSALLVAYAVAIVGVACNGILGIDAPTLVPGDGGQVDATTPDAARHDGAGHADSGHDHQVSDETGPARETGAHDAGVDSGHHDSGHDAGLDRESADASRDAPHDAEFSCACDGSSCSPVLVAAFDGSVGAMVGGAGVLYFSLLEGVDQQAGLIVALRLGADRPEILDPDAALPSGMALSGSTLFWSEIGREEIRSCSVETMPASCSPATFAMTSVGENGMAANGTDVYWATALDQLAYCGVSGCPGSSFDLLPGGSAGPLAADDAGIVWVSGDTNGSTLACPSTGCADAAVALFNDSVAALAAFNGSVFWADTDGRLKVCDSSRSAAACAASARTLVAVDAGAEIDELAVDSTGVYWTGGSVVAWVGLDGGSIATLASSRSQPSRPVVGSSCVFWTESVFEDPPPGSIVATAKH
jgi:hypothetical protein